MSSWVFENLEANMDYFTENEEEKIRASLNEVLRELGQSLPISDLAATSLTALIETVQIELSTVKAPAWSAHFLVHDRIGASFLCARDDLYQTVNSDKRTPITFTSGINRRGEQDITHMAGIRTDIDTTRSIFPQSETAFAENRVHRPGGARFQVKHAPQHLPSIAGPSGSTFRRIKFFNAYVAQAQITQSSLLNSLPKADPVLAKQLYLSISSAELVHGGHHSWVECASVINRFDSGDFTGADVAPTYFNHLDQIHSSLVGPAVNSVLNAY